MHILLHCVTDVQKISFIYWFDSSLDGSGSDSGSCDINSDGVITAAELLAFTGTSIDWQAVINSVEASLSGSDTNNNGLIDTSAEFAELKRVTGC